MKSLSFLLAPLLMTGVVLRAADDVVLPALTLKDGRVFHHVKVLNSHALTLNIVADEGLAQVNKSSLPPEIAKQYPIDSVAAAKEQKAEEVSAEVSRKLEEEHHKQVLADQKKAAEEIERRTVLNGVRILSFVQFGNGCALVEIRNETDMPVTLPGRSMLARSSANQVLPGFWLQHASPDAKRYQGGYVVPGNSTLRVPVLFTLKRAISVTEVFWQHA